MKQQQDGEHDQLCLEYEGLWSNVDLILEKIEKHVNDQFCAKVCLSEIFMDGYEQSKTHVIKLIMKGLDDLYTCHVKPDPQQKARLEKISHAYGLLLHSSGAKAAENQPVAQICKQIRENRSKETWIADLPLEYVVEVAWKFVTQPCPIIVCQPPKFDTAVHTPARTKRWNEEHKDSRPLIYAKPVVFRSYHGVLLKDKALVGNQR
jgi:hypothetical protein